MSIKVYASNVQAAAPQGTPRVPLQQALDTRNTGDQQAIKSVLNSGAKLSESEMKVATDDHNAALATDILDEATAYSDATRAFEKEYRDTHKGKDAANMDKDLDLFHTQQANERGLRFAGNPQQQSLWERQQAQIRQSSLNGSVGYMSQQDQLYRADTTKARTAMLINKVGELGNNDAGVKKAIEFYKAEVDVMNPGRDMTALYAQTDLDIATTRIGLANANNDPDEGERLLRLHGSGAGNVLGKSLDEVTKQVRSVRVNKDAMNHTEFIRRTMPEATRGEMFDKLKEMSNGDNDVYAKGRGYINQAFSDIDQAKKQSSKTFRTSFTEQLQAADSTEGLQALQSSVNANPNISPEDKTWATGKINQGVKAPPFSKDEAILGLSTDIVSGKFTADELKVKYHGSVEPIYLKSKLKSFEDVNRKRAEVYINDMQTRTLKNIYPNKSDEKRVIVPFTKKMELWYESKLAADGKMPSDAEFKAHEQFLLKEVAYNYNHAWFDKTARVFEAQGFDAKEFDPPPSVRLEIKADLRNNNLPVTEENIQELYRRSLLKEN